MRTHLTRLAVSLLVGLALTVGAARAHARHTVLRKDGPDVYVDLGTDQGVVPGTSLALYHAISAVHPVTGKRVRDTFLLGTLEVVRAGRSVCIAHAPEEIDPRVAVGDEIAMASHAVPWTDPWRPPADEPAEAAAKPTTAAGRVSAAEAQVAAAAAVEAAWLATLGQPPAARIAIWKGFLAANPASPFARAVKVELGSLQAQVDVAKALADEATRAGASAPAAALTGKLTALAPDVVFGGPLAFVPPRRAYEGTPVELAALVLVPDQVTRAWVSFRRAGAASYQRVDLVADGNIVHHALPAEVVHPPGVEYFVEVLAAGAAEPREVLGTAVEPLSIAVDASVAEPPPDRRGRSRVTMFLDYVDFDGGGADGFDQYQHGEVDFMYRFRGPVHSLRLGFGSLTGTGGPKDVIDADPTGQCLDAGGVYRCRKVGYTYTFVELELHLSDVVAVLVRPVAGGAYRDETPSGTPGDARVFSSALGLKTRLRLGREAETNLTIGASLTQALGTLFEAVFTWDVVRQFPIVLSAQVTDQPVLETFGVRMIADIGWRGTSWVYPSARISYQARDINHTGVSGGLAVNFDW